MKIAALLMAGLSRLPLSVLYAVSFVLYLLLYRVFKLRRAVVRDNLRGAFPDLDPAEIRLLERRFYRDYADVFMEMVKSLSISPQELAARVTLRGADRLSHHLERQQSVLVTVAHQCNIEWLLLALCVKFNFPVEAIYRPISDPVVEEMMVKAYQRFGGRTIRDREVVKELMRGGDRARIVTIAADQSPNPGDETHWTEFLGRETGFFMAPDTIAKFTRFPVYFVSMTRVARGQYAAEVEVLAEPPYRAGDSAVVAAYVRAVEAQIRAHPAGWLWMHRRWKRKRPLYS